MNDYLVKIENTKLRYILRGGYTVIENQDIVLAEKTMADGTKRRNIAEKKRTTINIQFSQIPGVTLQEYSSLWKNDFTANYWSKDDRTYKTALFRLKEQPSNSLLNTTQEMYDEFSVTWESV